MNSKLREYEQELLDYLRTDKLKSKKFILHESSKYPEDRIQVITNKNKNKYVTELYFQRVRSNKSPEIISNVYEYNGKESKALKNITLEQLIKGSKHRYFSNYLESVKYNNKSPSTKSKETPELPNDILLHEIVNKVSNSNTLRSLKETSKLFKDIKVSPKYKLDKNHIEALLDYIKTNKTDETLLLFSSEYPDDEVVISTIQIPESQEKKINIWRMKGEELSDNLSKVYTYNRKESETFKDIKIQDLMKLIKKKNQDYMYRYLQGLYNTSKYSNKIGSTIHQGLKSIMPSINKKNKNIY